MLTITKHRVRVSRIICGINSGKFSAINSGKISGIGAVAIGAEPRAERPAGNEAITGRYNVVAGGGYDVI